MRIILIGCGGVGGWLARGLAATLEHSNVGDKKLLLVDGDHFEASNNNRQDFDQLGPKPEVRCEELSYRYPMIDCVPINRWVVETVPETEEEDTQVVAASDLIQNGDCVICVVDNFACRATVADAASKVDNIDLILAGNDDAYYGSVYHYCRVDGQDVTRNPLWMDELSNPTDRNPGEMSCEERAQQASGTQLLFTNMAVAAAVGAKVINTVINGNRLPNTDEYVFDLDQCRGLGHDRSEEVREQGVEQALEVSSPDKS